MDGAAQVVAMSTKERLAQVLHARGFFELERKAREGLFDDYESPSATPQMDLVAELRSLSAGDLVQRVINGEWDGTAEEGDAWFEREGRAALLADLEKKR